MAMQEKLPRSATSSEFRDRLKKALIGSDAVAEAGKEEPAKLPGGSKILDEEEKKKGDSATVAEVEKANEDAKRSGVMVALMLDSGAAKQLCVENGEPCDDMHITLAYIGKLENLPEDVEDRVTRALSAAVRAQASVVGKVSGVGRFNGSSSSDGKDVVYASFDSPGLPSFREKLVMELNREGVPAKSDHGFTPHITLAYVDRELPNPVNRVEDLELRFDNVALVIGNKLSKSFQFLTKSTQTDISKNFPVYTVPSDAGGVHMHRLLREKKKTGMDGEHSHVFLLPDDGGLIYTHRDGAHEHGLSSMESSTTFASASKHRHVVEMYDGAMLETDVSGTHRHAALIRETAADGQHTHTLVLSDGKRLSSLTAGELWAYNFEKMKEFQAMQAAAVGKEERFGAVISVPIIKRDDDQRIVTGIVLEPDEVDAHNDTISPEVIEEAAHKFLARFNRGTKLGVMHNIFGEIGVELVESFISRESMEINGKKVKKGSWIITVKIFDDLIWKKVKDGSITGFSIGGVATVV